MAGYPFDDIEPRWQRFWDEHQTFRTPGPGDPGFDPSRPKYYVLDMFPYPSGAGLHVGHPEGYTATDILARARRMQGYNVLHPIGWDAFGLPAEQYAIETGTHPRETTQRNITRFREQLKMLGFSYDWSREVNTTDPNYYRWTQWIFLQLYRAGLAVKKEAPVNWCPGCNTVLANEQVIAGECERCGSSVELRNLSQWFFRITDYAERLLGNLQQIDWSDTTKRMQENWIGRSEGAEIAFPIADHEERIEVFTTRPDTLFGATFMVLAPEHPLLERIERLDKELTAFTYVAGWRARRAAEAWDRAKRRGQTPMGPLSGVPTGIKDLAFVRGMPTRFGSRAVPILIPARDGVVTRRVRRAGMIITGKLTTAEFGAMPVTETDTHAPTRNPFHLDYSAGGSSGGSAAAVAAQLLPI